MDPENEKGIENNSTLSQLERAELLVKEMQEREKAFKELVERQEKAKIESMLGGRSTSNQEQPRPKRELTPREAINLFGKGVNLQDPMPLVDA